MNKTKGKNTKSEMQVRKFQNYEKPDSRNYWALKSVSDETRTYRSIEGYADELTNIYVYDNLVANHKQVKSGDIAVIVDKKKVLGFVKVARVKKLSAKKKLSRCPKCRSTNYEERSTPHLQTTFFQIYV